jgi:hypothetical protein
MQAHPGLAEVRRELGRKQTVGDERSGRVGRERVRIRDVLAQLAAVRRPQWCYVFASVVCPIGGHWAYRMF